MKKIDAYSLSKLREAREIGEENIKADLNRLRDLPIDPEDDKWLDADIEYLIDLLWYLEEYKDIE